MRNNANTIPRFTFYIALCAALIATAVALYPRISNGQGGPFQDTFCLADGCMSDPGIYADMVQSIGIPAFMEWAAAQEPSNVSVTRDGAGLITQIACGNAGGAVTVTASYGGGSSPTPPPPAAYCVANFVPDLISEGQATDLSFSIDGPATMYYAFGNGQSGGPFDVPAVYDYGPSYPDASVISETYSFSSKATGAYCWATVNVCPQGQVAQGGQCVIPCPTGYTLQGGQCIKKSCPAGYTLQGDSCVTTSCPQGYTLTNGQCINQCGGAQYFCQGNDMYTYSAGCQASLYRRCSYGCSGGVCILAKAPNIITWNVHPVLVEQGTPVSVEWEADNVSSCSITGTNG